MILRPLALLALLAACTPSAVSNMAQQETNMVCGRQKKSPAEFLSDMKAEKLPVQFQDTQYVAYSDTANMTVWTFTKPGNYAYPTVVCRKPVQQENTVRIHTQVICGASKKACDRLAQEFQKINENLKHTANP
jgi:hypothetical protein